MNGTTGAVLVITMVSALALLRARTASIGSKASRMSAQLSEMVGLCAPPSTTVDSTTPPRWAMPWVSLMRTGTPMLRAASPIILEASTLPCPPTPTI